MIGVQPKKQEELNPIDTGDVPIFDLQDGQGGLYGKVTERNALDNSLSPAKDVQVTLFDANQLVVFTSTREDGLYQFDAINAPKNYRIEFEKESIKVVKDFSIQSKQIKQINATLTANNL